MDIPTIQYGTQPQKDNISDLESVSQALTPYIILGLDSSGNSTSKESLKHLKFSVSSISGEEMVNIDSFDLYHNINKTPAEYETISEFLSDGIHRPSPGLPVKLQKVHFRASNGPHGEVNEYYAYFMVSDPVSITNSSHVGAVYCQEGGNEPSDEQICKNPTQELDKTSTSWGGETDDNYRNRIVIGESLRHISSVLSTDLFDDNTLCSEQDLDRIHLLASVSKNSSDNPSSCEEFALGKISARQLSKALLYNFKDKKLTANMEIEQVGDTYTITWDELTISDDCEIITTSRTSSVQCVLSV